MADTIVAAYPGFTVMSMMPGDVGRLADGTVDKAALAFESVIAWRIGIANDAWPITIGSSHDHPEVIWAVCDPKGAVAMHDHAVFRSLEAWWDYIQQLLA